MLREMNVLYLEDLFIMRGPTIWSKLGQKLRERSLVFSPFCKAMAN
jgi:hypothetical protein